MLPIQFDFALWNFFCRSLVAACAQLEREGTDLKPEEVFELSRLAGEHLNQISKHSPYQALTDKWELSVRELADYVEEIGGSDEIRKLAKRAATAFLKTEARYHVAGIASNPDDQNKIALYSIESELWFASDKARRFWGVEGSESKRLPTVEMQRTAHPIGVRGFLGLGCVAEIRSRYSKKRSARQELCIYWTPGNALFRDFREYGSKDIKHSTGRDILDYLRFRSLIAHEMYHFWAPSDAEFTAISGDRPLHGWLTYMQVQDALDMATNSGGVVNKLLAETLLRLLDTEARDTDFASTYFGIHCAKSGEGWDLLEKISENVKGKTVTSTGKAVCTVCNSCPYYRRASALTPYALVHVLTRHNVVVAGTRQGLECCAPEQFEGKRIKVCHPLNEFLSNRSSVVQDYIGDIERIFCAN